MMEPELIEILKRMEANMGRIEAKVDKNTVMLEDLTIKVQLIAEVQTSHKEQNEKQTEQIIETFGERAGLIETAVTNVSQ